MVVAWLRLGLDDRNDRRSRRTLLNRATLYSSTAAPMFAPARKTSACVEVIVSLTSADPNVPAQYGASFAISVPTYPTADAARSARRPLDRLS